jgi:plastocyanin
MLAMIRRLLGMPLLVVAASAAILLTGPTPAAQQPAAIRGRVEIGIPLTTRRPSSAYPTRAVVTQALAPTSELRNVVVYLKDAPSRPVTPMRVDIRQRDENFIPRVVAVPVGSEVGFPNDDPIYHNVFSLSRSRSFNLGRYPRGHTRGVQFDRPGIVKVFCDIHSHMSATVMVFNHPWFTVAAEDGRFELPAVPAGEREVTAWHERLGDTTQRVIVETGRVAEANFVLPVPPQ